jgi:hypothetical protein
MQAHGFSHAALHTIADHGSAHRARDGEADLRAVLPIWYGEAESSEVRARPAEAVVIDVAEIAAAEDPVTLGESEPVACDGNG